MNIRTWARHSHPVYSLGLAGDAGAPTLVTASSDGMVCYRSLRCEGRKNKLVVFMKVLSFSAHTIIAWIYNNGSQLHEPQTPFNPRPPRKASTVGRLVKQGAEVAPIQGRDGTAQVRMMDIGGEERLVALPHHFHNDGGRPRSSSSPSSMPWDAAQAGGAKSAAAAARKGLMGAWRSLVWQAIHM
jgi:hypothetical protein